MKKLYTYLNIVVLLFFANNLFAQPCNFTYTEFPTGAPYCEGITLIFSDASVGAISWDWDFGAGAIPQFSTQQFPGLVIFPVCGIYNVSISINGGACTHIQAIAIYCDPVACFTVNPPAACVGTPFNFTSCSQVGQYSNSLSYVWDFGDGDSTFQFNPQHVYIDTGCFTASLIVTNNHGCTDFFQIPYAACISAPPSFQISGAPTTTCLSTLTVTYQINPPPTGGTGPYTYNWTFTGGSPSSYVVTGPAGLSPPPITYGIGSWTVSCTVTDVSGCSTTVTLPNYVNVGNNSTSIILSDDSVCVGQCINVSTASASSYAWSINPTTCVLPNTSQNIPAVDYCFSCAGNYVITLNAVVNGCAVSATSTIHVIENPVACINITSNPPSCSFPQTVNVQYCGPLPVVGYQYIWSFPGGTPSSYIGTSISPNPPNAGAITYNACGHFSISLTVVGFSGCDSITTLIDTVKIDCPQACYSITDLPMSGNYCAPLSLHFDATCSTGSPTQYLWCVQSSSMPPCIPTNNLGPTPTLNFPTEGCFNVTLKTINAQGCISTITNAFPGGPVCVGAHTQPCFAGNPLVTCAALPVSFTNCTPDTNGVAGGPGFSSCHSWCWNFGDAGGCQSSLTNPQHLYQDTGCFDVMLVSKNCGCYDTIIHEDYVCILPPVPYFNYTINCDSPNVVLYDGTNSIGADTYLWNFPGGTPSTSTSPIVPVVYPMPNPNATYTATLKICNNASGCCDSLIVYVFLHNLEAIATVDTIVCFSETSAVTNNSIGAASYIWHGYDICNNYAPVTALFSTLKSWNNNSSIGEIIWPGPGIYLMRLRVIANNGCEDTLEWNVSVRGLSPQFGGAPLTGCAPFSTTFNDTTNSNCVSNPVTHKFSFGDGTSSSFIPINSSVTHTYTTNGSFTVTDSVKDQYGCISSFSAVNYINAGLAISETHINPSCGNNNGSIDLSVNSGGSPYTYLWSNGMTTQDLAGLATGIYSVTVNDINSCLTIFSVSLSNSNALMLSETHGNTTCGNSNGNINVIINSGSAPFNYLWSNGATTQDINNLASGNYSLTVTAANTCTSTINVTINNSNGPQLNEQHANASCGSNNGTIDLSVSGGTPNYIYHWNNNATTQDLANLGAGNYHVTVTDNNNCTAVISIVISITTSPIITEFHSDEMCDSANGSLNISVSNGTAPYTYNWSTGTTTEDLSNLSAGNYSVTVTDANNCTAIISAPIINHPAPTITVTHVDASCLNCHDGSATVFIGGGGTSPYTIEWNIGSTNNPITNLDPGTYVVCVTDANGCSVCDSTVVSNADGIISITDNEFVQIIPNPNNGIFILEISNSLQIEKIEIVNLIGEKVLELNNPIAEKIQIDFLSALNGIYFLQVKSTNGIIRKKILINH